MDKENEKNVARVSALFCSQILHMHAMPHAGQLLYIPGMIEPPVYIYIFANFGRWARVAVISRNFILKYFYIVNLEMFIS